MRTINGKEVKQKIQSKSRVVGIDHADSFKKRHVATAVNIPYESVGFASKVMKKSPNKDTDIVLCCEPECSKDAVSAGRDLEKEGFKNVYSHTLGAADLKKSGVEVIEMRS